MQKKACDVECGEWIVFSANDKRCVYTHKTDDVHTTWTFSDGTMAAAPKTEMMNVL